MFTPSAKPWSNLVRREIINQLQEMEIYTRKTVIENTNVTQFAILKTGAKNIVMTIGFTTEKLSDIQYAGDFSSPDLANDLRKELVSRGYEEIKWYAVPLAHKGILVDALRDMQLQP